MSKLDSLNEEYNITYDSDESEVDKDSESE